MAQAESPEATNPRAGVGARWLALIVGTACVAVGIAADLLFLPHQSLWLDESVQLAGLSLDPVEVTRWLADRVNYDFGLMDDRMPPLSYWMGWGWSRVAGLAERPMRMMGVVCVSIAVAIVFAAGLRAWGLAAGAAAALLLATSPNAVMTAVEIRAYPILILFSAGIFACLIGIAEGPAGSRWRWLAGLTVCGIGAMYTHFFGLVAFGGAWLAAVVLAWTRGERLGPLIVVAVVAGLAALGLLPFILASAGMSSSAQVAGEAKFIGLVRLGYRLFGNPAMAMSPAAVGLAALGTIVGVLSALWPGIRRAPGAAAMAIALVSGGAVVALVHLAQSSFESARPSYNIWMLPVLAVLVASGLSVVRSRGARMAAGAAAAMLITANLYADAQLAVHGDSFAHTAYGPIARIIHRLGPDQLALIHDGPIDQAWGFYFPVRYEFRGDVRQFAYVSGRDESGTGEVRVSEFPSGKGRLDPAGLRFPYLVVVRSKELHATDLNAQIRGGAVPQGDGPVALALLASGKWERVEERISLAFVRAEVDVFRRAGAE